MQSEIIFTILALFTVAGALFMITARRPIDAALSFIVTLVSLAGLFALLGSTFLFAVQIIIYAGAILALILFIIMFLNIKDENLPPEPRKLHWMMATSAIVVPFCLILVELIAATQFGAPAEAVEGFGSIRAVGLSLFSDWVLPFELVSVLLLVALIGAVTLAEKREET